MEIAQQPNLWNDGVKCPSCGVLFPCAEVDCDTANHDVLKYNNDLLEFCLSLEDDYDNTPVLKTESQKLLFLVDTLQRHPEFGVFVSRAKPSVNDAATNLLLARVECFRTSGPTVNVINSSHSKEMTEFYALPLGPLSRINMSHGKLTEVEDGCAVCSSSFLFGHHTSVASQCRCLRSVCAWCTRNTIAQGDLTYYALDIPQYRCGLCRSSLARWENVREAVDLENRLVESAWNYCSATQRSNYFQFAIKGVVTFSELMFKLFDKLKSDYIIMNQFDLTTSVFKNSSMEQKRLIIARAELRRLLADTDKMSELDDHNRMLPLGPLQLLTFPSRTLFDIALEDTYHDFFNGSEASGEMATEKEEQNRVGDYHASIVETLLRLGLLLTSSDESAAGRRPKTSIFVPGVGCLCPLCDLNPCAATAEGKNPLAMKFQDFRVHMYIQHPHYEFENGMLDSVGVRQCEHCNKLYNLKECDGCLELRKHDRIRKHMEEMAPYTLFMDVDYRFFAITAFAVRSVKGVFVDLNTSKTVTSGSVGGRLVPKSTENEEKLISIKFDRWIINGRDYETVNRAHIFQGILLMVNPTKDIPLTSYYKLVDPSDDYQGLFRPLRSACDAYCQLCKLLDSMVRSSENPLRLIDSSSKFESLLRKLPASLLPYLKRTTEINRLKDFLGFMMAKNCRFSETMRQMTAKTALAAIHGFMHVSKVNSPRTQNIFELPVEPQDYASPTSVNVLQSSEAPHIEDPPCGIGPSNVTPAASMMTTTLNCKRPAQQMTAAPACLAGTQQNFLPSLPPYDVSSPSNSPLKAGCMSDFVPTPVISVFESTAALQSDFLGPQVMLEGEISGKDIRREIFAAPSAVGFSLLPQSAHVAVQTKNDNVDREYIHYKGKLADEERAPVITAEVATQTITTSYRLSGQLTNEVVSVKYARPKRDPVQDTLSQSHVEKKQSDHLRSTVVILPSSGVSLESSIPSTASLPDGFFPVSQPPCASHNPAFGNSTLIRSTGSHASGGQSLAPSALPSFQRSTPPEVDVDYGAFLDDSDTDEASSFADETGHAQCDSVGEGEDGSVGEEDEDHADKCIDECVPTAMEASESDYYDKLVEEAEGMYPTISLPDNTISNRRDYENAVANADIIHKRFLQHCKFQRFKNYSLWFEVKDLLEPEHRIVNEHRGDLYLKLRIYYTPEKFREASLSLPRIKNKLGALKSMINLRYGVELGRSILVRS
jgi:hypothetical protein